MFGKKGFRSSPGWLFGIVDSLLILTGIFLGCYFRIWRGYGFYYFGGYLALRMLFIVFVIQVCFYYLDLYDSKTFREKRKMGILLLGALGASSILLAVVYYLVPFLIVGRGIFAISILLILIFTFLWRVIYAHVVKTWVRKERLLIVGTGELAEKLKGEILDNGYDGFEIVGFIDESRDKIGNRV